MKPVVLAVLAAATALVGVVPAASAASSAPGGPHDPSAPGRGRVPAASADRAGAAHLHGADPAGWRTLTWHGEHFTVPADWPVVDLATAPSTCVRFDRHAVYEGAEGPDPSCPATAAGVTEAMQLEVLGPLTRSRADGPRRVATIGGQTAEVAADPVAQRLTAELPAARLVVTLSYGRSRSTAERILASFATVAHPSTLGRTATVTGASVSSNAVTGATVFGNAVTGTALSGVAGSGAVGSGTVTVGPHHYRGLGFDSCAAPNEAAMASWRRSSPFRAVGVYIGGVNRACGDGPLSAAWVRTEVADDWHILPIYVGPQAPCAYQGGLAPITHHHAAATGIAAGEDAVAQAQALGMGPGSPIFDDMEAWDTDDPMCARTVVNYVTAWGRQLERQGYVPAIYGSADAGLAQDIAPRYGRPGAPELVDFAQWDGRAGTRSPYLPADVWPTGDRTKQFVGNATLTYGGVTVAVDEDWSNTTLVGRATP